MQKSFKDVLQGVFSLVKDSLIFLAEHLAK